MRQTITIRHRTATDDPVPPFSARSFRNLSSGFAAASVPGPGFADTRVPLSGKTLAQCVYLSGLFTPPALCSGAGHCALCRVRFLSAPPPVLDAEKAVLSHHDLDAGWRLACHHAPEDNAHILIPALPVVCASQKSTPVAVRKGRFALAVDLGTTSIHWQVVPVDGTGAGSDLPHGTMINPQMGAGSDVVARIAHATEEEGAAVLRRLVTNALAGIADACAAKGYVAETLCVAGNPAMTGIFLGHATRSLARAPYALPCSGNLTTTVPGLPPVYVPPQISPFVGGDVSAGYAALALDPGSPVPAYPFLLADLGTNGECLLALSPTESLAASLPMGPALEGVNLTFGCLAGIGAVVDYVLTPYGFEPVVLGDTAPTGITATGYLSLLRVLRVSGLLTENGQFARREDLPLAGKVAGESGDSGGERSIRLPGKMALYASDVEELLKVKAAFSLTLSRLLRTASLTAADLSRIYFAGAFGMHVPVEAMTSLGFVPPGTGKRIVTAGNTSLAGASLFLRHPAAREACARWAGNVTTLNLAGEAAFGQAFAGHMFFAWR